MSRRIISLLVSIATVVVTLGLLGSIVVPDATTPVAAPSASWVATAFPVPQGRGAARQP